MLRDLKVAPITITRHENAAFSAEYQLFLMVQLAAKLAGNDSRKIQPGRTSLLATERCVLDVSNGMSRLLHDIAA
ncbi:MAG TPA: hypothetical protein VEL31_29555 [Ktedonobacteraceae bacterium]|nr:hypothetical protein [Ktedonobacteraceae bacterium]